MLAWIKPGAKAKWMRLIGRSRYETPVTIVEKDRGMVIVETRGGLHYRADPKRLFPAQPHMPHRATR